jgi:multidrug efflux pump subunit AcrB
VTGGRQLWVPMGSVIFFGTLITMLFNLTVIPVAYYTINKHTIYKKSVNE